MVALIRDFRRVLLPLENDIKAPQISFMGLPRSRFMFFALRIRAIVELHERWHQSHIFQFLSSQHLFHFGFPFLAVTQLLRSRSHQFHSKKRFQDF